MIQATRVKLAVDRKVNVIIAQSLNNLLLKVVVTLLAPLLLFR